MGTSKDRDPATPGPYAGIDGIAAGRGRALAAVGVPDRAALARQDPERLHERLKAVGASGLSLERVSRWVVKARQLEGIEGPPVVERDARSGPSPEPPGELLDGWIPTASFSLWFARDPRRDDERWRSIVYHEGGAGEWQVFDGLDTWADWIAECARLPGWEGSVKASEAPEPEVPEAPEAPEAPVAIEAIEAGSVAAPLPRLELTEVEVSQRGDGLPAIEATVRGSLAEPVAAGAIEYHAYVQLVDADSGTPMSQATAQGPVTGGALAVRCALPFPPPGLYRVRSLIALDPDGPPVERDGPPFRVA